ncbi:MAG: HAD-IIIA family hydrolase [Spirochaetes bacterium]|nr:HAD-IIIA family hydrolase [Spirochaetota bacterium]
MKAFFFDRDGTLNLDEAGYISDPKEMHLYQSASEVLKYLKLLEYKIFVISNQSGIGRGLIKPEAYRKVNSKFLTLAGGYNTIDDIMYCLHAPDHGCQCRKPKMLFFDIIKEHYKIDFRKSYFVGDKITDIVYGTQAGLKTILIAHKNLKTETDYIHEGKKIKPYIQIESIEEILNIIGE